MKCPNALLTERALDFAIASFAQRHSHHSAKMGSPGYRAAQGPTLTAARFTLLLLQRPEFPSPMSVW